MIVTLGCLVGIGLLWGAWLLLRPRMTVSLTFDDGLKSHVMAAHELERYGWRGTFNVITDFLSDQDIELTDAQRKDLCVDRVKGRYMTWDDARELVTHGHEVYPHTCNHTDLVKLANENNIVEMDRQIDVSVQSVTEHLGCRPAFFCSPHNSCDRRVLLALRKRKLVPVTGYRFNFGADTPAGTSSGFSAFIRKQLREGRRHADMMVHGILGDGDGWRPFAGLDDFCEFLCEIRAAETEGLIEVVPYSQAHRCYGHPILSCVDIWLARGKRLVYKLVVRS